MCDLQKAVVNVPVADLRKEKEWLSPTDFSHNEGRLSQLLLNDPLVIHKNEGEWAFVEAVHHLYFDSQKQAFTGYFGFLHKSEILPVTAFPSPNVVICKTNHLFSYGTLLVGKKAIGGYEVTLPTQETLFIEHPFLRPLKPTTDRAFQEEAKQFVGIPYLWGGASDKGADCSGLIYLLQKAQGKLIARDAHDQYLQGNTTTSAYFYREKKPKVQTTRVCHVILKLNRNTYLEAPETGKKIQLLKMGQDIEEKKGTLIIRERPSLKHFCSNLEKR